MKSQKLTTFHFLLYILDNTLGYTTLILPSLIQYTKYVYLNYLIITFCCLMALILSINYSRLGRLFPEGYGEPTYYEFFYGKNMRLIYSLFSILIISPLCLLSSIGFAVGPIQGIDWIKKLVLISLLSFLNIFYPVVSLKIQAYLTTIKILLLLEVPILTFLVKFNILKTVESISLNVFNQKDELIKYYSKNGKSGFKNFIVQIPIILNAFDGFNSGNYITRELADPEKIFRYLPLTSIFMLCLYFITQTCFFYIVPLKNLLSDENFAVDILFHKQFAFFKNKTKILQLINAFGALSSVNGTFIILIYVTKSLTKDYQRVSGIIVGSVFFASFFIKDIETIMSYQSFFIYLFYVLTMFLLFRVEINFYKYFSGVSDKYQDSKKRNNYILKAVLGLFVACLCALFNLTSQFYSN